MPDVLEAATTDDELDEVVLAGLLDEQAATRAAAKLNPRAKRMPGRVSA